MRRQPITGPFDTPQNQNFLRRNRWRGALGAFTVQAALGISVHAGGRYFDVTAVFVLLALCVFPAAGSITWALIARGRGASEITCALACQLGTGVGVATPLVALAVGEFAIMFPIMIFCFLVMFIPAALGLAYFSNQLVCGSRKSTPPDECPACGYSTVGLTVPRCPECGQRVVLRRNHGQVG